MDMSKEAKEAEREYYREWRKNNKDKVKATKARFFERKAAEMKLKSSRKEGE